MLAISKETERIVSRRCHRGGKRARKTFHLVTHWYTRTTPHRRLPVPPVRRLEPRACLLLVSVPGSPAVLARDSAAVVARAAAEDLRLVEPVMLVGRLAGAVRRFTLVPEGLAGALLLGAVAGAWRAAAWARRARSGGGGGCLLGAVGDEVVVVVRVRGLVLPAGGLAAAARVEDFRLVEPVMLVGRLAGAVCWLALVAEGLAVATAVEELRFVQTVMLMGRLTGAVRRCALVQEGLALATTGSTRILIVPEAAHESKLAAHFLGPVGGSGVFLGGRGALGLRDLGFCQ
jgi:hypothetical protein